MAHHIQLAGIAAVLGTVLMRPGDRLGAVLQKQWVTHLRVKPVVGDHHHDAARSQGFADETVVIP